ncbi:MAG: hypothetical protein H8F28_08735 [Fibrella sp.]|nr:hypothetical protein [Armatimonadota bacterium]
MQVRNHMCRPLITKAQWMGIVFVALLCSTTGCAPKATVTTPAEKKKFMGRPPSATEQAMISQKMAEMRMKGNPGPKGPDAPAAKPTRP